MSDDMLVRLVVAGFVVSLLVRFWYAARRTEPAAPVRVRAGAGRRRSLALLVSAARRRVAADPSSRLRTFRPSGERTERAGRRLASSLPRRHGVGRRQPWARLARRATPPLRPVL
ncbi:hypothetical protein Cme02nite_03900 [Catellatospora methionotrophica]|uniref:Uncharacterized protein n=1 Tax=Catellatospora methionotrophica TaxID=121620 RepID=A0A8J3L5B0_9ACTN|nr:hypothetical protein [Catellatospora methionotrophica]GIG12058.1 hypothetical protein Cme02nite_03900 [Catellatospora methionotrophica]